MRTAPTLDPAVRPGAFRPRSVLLINPFYPKDPHASFGKHVIATRGCHNRCGFCYSRTACS